MAGEKVIDQADSGIASALAGLAQVPPPVEEPPLPLPAATIDYIKKQIADAVASGIEEGAKRVGEKYEEYGTWMKVAAGAQVVTAVGVVAILLALLLKDSKG